MQTLIIKDGIAITTHTAEQYAEVLDKYPGCEIVRWTGDRVSSGDADPRDDAQRAADAMAATLATLATIHTTEQAAGVTVGEITLPYAANNRRDYHELKEVCRDAIAVGIPETPVAFWDASGQKHAMRADEALPVLVTYTLTAAAEVLRQNQEIADAMEGGQ